MIRRHTELLLYNFTLKMEVSFPLQQFPPRLFGNVEDGFNILRFE
jgi:hypothetical protein